MRRYQVPIVPPQPLVEASFPMQHPTTAEGSREQGVFRMDVAAGSGAEIFSNAVGWRVDQMNITLGRAMENEGMLCVLFQGLEYAHPSPLTSC
jgi:hypothetical protein